MALGTALAIAAISTSSNPQKQDMGSLTENVPVKSSLIHGAKKVQEYMVQDSRYTLTHIRQRHPTRFFSKPRKDIVEVQNNIYNILSSYSNDGPLTLYEEGLDTSLRDRYNSFIEEISSELKRGKSLEDIKFPQLDYTDWLRLLRTSKDAGTRFSVERGLQLYAPELQKTLDLALEASLEAFLFPDNPEAMDYREKVVMDDRENVALERIVQDFPQGNNSVILIYGASHDFRDNIAEWNRTHPNMKYSLRIISPKGNGIGSYTQSK